MLSIFAHKWSWRKRRLAEGTPCDLPNIVMGVDVHTVWERVTGCFDVELKLIPL